MQTQDNVVLFPNSSRTTQERNKNRRGWDALEEPPTVEKRKGDLEMARQQSVMRVTKTHPTRSNKAPYKQQRRLPPSGGGGELHPRNERFRDLARKRVPKALNALRLIENLASHNYKYTPEQAQAIIGALESGLQRIKDAFNRPKRVEPEINFNI